MDTYNQHFLSLLATYSLAVRNYILNHDKQCYFYVRRARVSATSVTDAILASVQKCVAYKDRAHSRC